MDPHGYPGTIDPEVNVLRVDQVVGGRHVPIGAFPTFANHGTAVHAPALPVTLQDRHVVQLGEEQQTPSTQLPLSHSAAAAQI